MTALAIPSLCERTFRMPSPESPPYTLSVLTCLLCDSANDGLDRQQRLRPVEEACAIQKGREWPLYRLIVELSGPVYD